MLKSNLKYIIKNNYWLQILFLKIKYFFSNKYYEIDFSIIKNKRFRTYVDIGAYRGEYINFLKTRSKKIIAFEPIKRNFNLLNNLFKKYDVFLKNYALGNKKQSMKINIPLYLDENKKITAIGSDQSSLVKNFKNKFTQIVQIQTGDYFLSKINDIDLIKIDVEGYELEVLMGLKKTLITNKPSLLIEIEKRHTKNYLKVFKFLKSLSYDVYYVDKLNSLKKINSKKINNFFLKNQNTYDLKKESLIKNYSNFYNKKKYICNFWFVNKFSKI